MLSLAYTVSGASNPPGTLMDDTTVAAAIPKVRIFANDLLCSDFRCFIFRCLIRRFLLLLMLLLGVYVAVLDFLQH